VVTLLASQILSFGGTEEEHVNLWIKKVERISRIHGVNDEVMLLAASGKLVNLQGIGSIWTPVPLMIRGSPLRKQSWIVLKTLFLSKKSCGK